MRFQWLAIILVLSLVTANMDAQWPTAAAQTQQYPTAPYATATADNGQYQQPNSGAVGNGNPDAADLQHGVARLGVVQGDINIQRGDNGQLISAVVNAPLMVHDHLQSASGSRAEVQFDAGTIIRLGPNTDIGFADLQYHKAQIQIGLGTIIFRVFPNAQTQVEIDTPSVGIQALTVGEYRIAVLEDGTSQITVRNGQLELSGPRGSEKIDAGRTVLVRGDASDPEMQTIGEIGRDQFDSWSEGRDAEFAGSASNRYVSADVQGAADLDQYGNWVQSGYGQVWHPQDVNSDWSPYSDGQWSYQDYYGWSWVDSAPWGWAPYHYGRWFWNTGYGWCWWPGAGLGAAYWSPALVGFYGIGRGIGIGIGLGFASLAWVALAPFEAFHGWWGAHAYGGFGFGVGFGGGWRGGYGIGAYRNAGFRGGVMMAAANRFGGPRQQFTAANRNQIQNASLISGRLPVSATRASYTLSNRTPRQEARFASAQSHNFYNQNAARQSLANRAFTSAAQNRFSPNNQALRNNLAGSNRNMTTSAPRGNANSGWQHFGAPSNGANSFHSAYSNAPSEAGNGWHRFGAPQTNTRPSTTQPQRMESPSRFSSGGFSQPAYRQPSYQQRYEPSNPGARYGSSNYSQFGQRAPQERYNGSPQLRYAAPQQHYSAPQQHFSAPRSSGGGEGGGHSGGGGGSHGGGGGHHR